MGKSSAIAPRKKVSKRAATTNKRSTDVEDKHTTVNSPSPDGLPTNAVHPGSRKKWRKWLEENHVNSSQGVWLVRWKKCADQDDVTYDEAVEEALCFGYYNAAWFLHCALIVRVVQCFQLLLFVTSKATFFFDFLRSF